MLHYFFRVASVIVILLLHISVAQSQDWQKLYNQALAAYDAGDLEETLSKGKEALEQSDSELSKLFTLKLLSTAASEAGKYDEGVGFGLMEVKMFSELELPDSAIYYSLHTLSINLISSGDFANAKRYLKSCSLAAYRHYGESSYEYNQILSELGYSYYMLDNPDSAMICLNSANEKLVEIPEGGVDFLNNSFLAGLIHFEKEEFLQARKEYKDLKELLELNGLENELIYAETCENLGNVYNTLQDFENAKTTLEASLSTYTYLGKENAEIPDLINSLALSYIKTGEQDKSDSLLALIGSEDMGRNVIINQINLANSHYVNGDYLSPRKIVENLEVSLDPEKDRSLLAEVYLLEIKLDLAERKPADLNKVDFCIQTFTSENNVERLLDSYLFKSRIQESTLDFAGAEISIQEAFSYLNAQAPQNNIYLIVRESISLFLRQGRPIEATTTFQRIESEHILDTDHRELLLNDYAVLLQIYGYAFESSLMLDLLVETSEYPTQPKYHINLIKSLISQSIYTQAKYEIDRLIKSARENGIDEDSELFAEIYSQRAKVYLNEGNYSLAETDFRNSIKILKNTGLENDVAMAEIYNSAAIFYQTIGNYEEAINYYAQAEEFVEDGSALSIDILQNLATLKQIIGDYLESIVLLESALEDYEKIYGREHPAYSTSLQNLATAYQKSGEPEKALPYLEEALRIDEANNMSGTVSHTTKLHNLAVLYQELDMLEKSESVFREVVNMRKEILGENHPDYAFSLYNLAVVLQRQNKNNEAKEVFNLAIAKYKSLVIDFFPYLSEKEKSAFYGKIQEAFTAWKDFTVEYANENPASAAELYDFQLENKAVLLNASVDLRSKIETSADAATISLFDEWLALKEEIVKLLSLSEADLKVSGKNISEIQANANELEKELSLKSAEFNQNMSEDEVSWKKIRDHLKEGEAAVEIFRIRKNIKNDSVWYVALVVRHDTQDYPKFEVFEDGLVMEKKWFNYYRNGIKFKITDTVSYAKFWEPLEKHLDNVKTVYVSPDGIYNKVSLSSIYDPVEENYILNKYDVHYLTNIQELAAIDGAEQVTRKEVHLYGDPLFSMKGNGTGVKGASITPLPGTANEIESIEDILKEKNWDIDVNTGPSASEKNIKQKSNAGVIHIATHGIFLADNNPENDFYSLENNPLMRSGLLLSGAENTFLGSQIVLNTSVEGEDGVLTAYEVMNMNLVDTDLVILSACETGLGEIKNGEGVYGLQRAFAIAGAKSVVISLWKVDDKATKDLMVSFYHYYVEGKNKFEALVSAQKEMMDKYKDPYIWGAFVMTGI